MSGCAVEQPPAVLYYIHPESVTRPTVLKHLRELLTDEERDRIASFHFAKERHDRLLARALLRLSLADFTNAGPSSLRFRSNAWGRPEIDLPAQHVGVGFSISHTCGLIVSLVGRGHEIGIDTEFIREIDDMLDIAGKHFAPRETASLYSTPPHQRTRRFLEIWTVKEAYVKARGIGLSLKLSDFEVTIDGTSGEISVSFGQPVKDNSSRWHFGLHRLSETHIVASAIARRNHQSVEFRIVHGRELLER